MDLGISDFGMLIFDAWLRMLLYEIDGHELWYALTDTVMSLGLRCRNYHVWHPLLTYLSLDQQQFFVQRPFQIAFSRAGYGSCGIFGL